MLVSGLVAKIASVCYCVGRRGSAPPLTSQHGERDVRGRAEDLEKGDEVTEMQRLEMSLEKTLGTGTSRADKT